MKFTNSLERFYENHIFNHYNAVFNYLILLTHDKNQADDISQETMLKAWAQIETIIGKRNIKAYLFKMGKNLFFDQYRKEQRLADVTLDYESDEQDDIVLRVIIENDNAAIIRGIINRMEFKYVQVLLLFYYYDMNLREIALATGENYNTIASRKRIALRLLANELDPTGEIRLEKKPNPYTTPSYLLSSLT